MQIRPVQEAELGQVSSLLAEQQADPRSHICYVGTVPAAIAEDLAALDPRGLAGVLVAADGDQVVGVLGVEWDDDPPRVWWHGPFVAAEADWDALAAALMDAGEGLLPPSVTEQELGPDDRNARVAALAERRGFTAEEASVVLQRRLDGRFAVAAPGDVAVVPLAEPHREAAAALHDRFFSHTHLPGMRIDEGRDRVVLVAVGEGGVLGYIAAERQSDGEGYIDFLGVDAAAREAGVGGLLVERACQELSDRYGCDTVNLTVRESNAVARRLYTRLGFVEERLIRPWRRGFGITR